MWGRLFLAPGRVLVWIGVGTRSSGTATRWFKILNMKVYLACWHMATRLAIPGPQSAGSCWRSHSLVVANGRGVSGLFPMKKQAACLWTEPNYLLSLLLLGSHIGEANSMAGHTVVLYAVSYSDWRQERRFLSRKANCQWALATVTLMCGSQLRYSLMVTSW